MIVDASPSAYVFEVQEPKIVFDLEKVKKVYENYTVNAHAGLTLVMGHPFKNEGFCEQIRKEQQAILQVFQAHGLEDALMLYDVDSQVHATLIELASQHDLGSNEQRLLKEEELLTSAKTQKPIDINFTARWIKKTPSFEIEVGAGVLSHDHRDQTLRITDTGQIVMKGRAKERALLSEIREEFEKEAGIVHKYGKSDDEFFFVIGYVKSDARLLDPTFAFDLAKCIEERRPDIQLALKVDRVKVILYQNYSLDSNACVFESKEFKLKEELDLPGQNLVEHVKQVISERSLLFELPEAA